PARPRESATATDLTRLSGENAGVSGDARLDRGRRAPSHDRTERTRLDHHPPDGRDVMRHAGQVWKDRATDATASREGTQRRTVLLGEGIRFGTAVPGLSRPAEQRRRGMDARVPGDHPRVDGAGFYARLDCPKPG